MGRKVKRLESSAEFKCNSKHIRHWLVLTTFLKYLKKHVRVWDAVRADAVLRLAVLVQQLLLHPYQLVMPPLTRENVASLTRTQLQECARGRVELPRAVLKSKDALVAYILASGCEEIFEEIRNRILNKEMGLVNREVGSETRKRKREERKVAHRKVARLETSLGEEAHDTSKFLELPTDAQVKTCYRQFYEATSNEAIRMEVCAICAQERSVRRDRVAVCKLADLPHSERLIPFKSHFAHDLYNGRLLEPEGCFSADDGNETMVRVCSTCMADLESTRDKPPRFSLANNLWTGRVPWQLQTLTFPEQLLIALLYPRIYVFKLYPKDPQFRPDPATLQRAMRGTVSTYDLNIDGVSSMVQGNLLPRLPSILPSVISITFIGRGTLPKRYLRSIFRVRRHFIFEALTWLKTNNPRYYGNIVIDPVRLGQLPEDDVPDEITAIVRNTSDIGLIDQESSGYVPLDSDMPEGELTYYACICCC